MKCYLSGNTKHNANALSENHESEDMKLISVLCLQLLRPTSASLASSFRRTHNYTPQILEITGEQSHKYKGL